MTADKSRGKRVASPPETAAIAVSLAKAGWPVFPVTIYVGEDGKRHKVPAVPKGTSWKDWATTDVDTVAKAWAGEHSGRWIGVYAGAAGIVVLDVDLKPANGYKSLKKAGLEIPPTLDYETGGGGRHYVYAAPEGVELTIARGLVHDGKTLEGIDVRSGNGLMVYYGGALSKKDVARMAPAPDWLLVTRERPAANDGTDRAPSADEDALRERLADGKPSADVLAALANVRPRDMGHEDMLAAVTELVGLGVKGHPGVGPALDAARETYSRGWPDAGRHWDNAVQGSIRRLGLPPATLALTKTERREIKKRNKPEAIEKKKKERAREYVAHLVETREEPADDDLSDDALADRFAATVRDVWANVDGVGLLRYDGTIWKTTDEALLVERARTYLRDVRQDATALAIRRGDKVLESDAKRLGQKGTIAAVARLTAGILLDSAPTLDADPDVLNVVNGVVDLRTGVLRERRPEDYFTKCAAVEYVPGARSKDWEKALEAVPKKTRPWLQRRLGQALTGRISVDKSVPFLTGGGDNGKSAVLGACRAAAGSYAVTVPEKLLLGSDSEHPTEIMTLRGARLAVFEELPRGGRLNAQRMKLLAGTNELSGRFMRENYVTFPATHTLIGASNHLPVISDVDDAIWERVAPVRFPYKFVSGEPLPKTNQRKGDDGLRDRLAEAPPTAVLAWLVEGAVLSYQGKAAKPPAVVRALEEWRGDADPVLGFVRDRLVLDPGAVIAATDLYAEFGHYLESRGQTRWSDNLMAVSFAGHSSLEGVRKRQLKLGPRSVLSRPAFTTKPIPARAMSFLGVRFAGDPRVPSEAELDAATFDDLAKRASR